MRYIGVQVENNKKRLKKYFFVIQNNRIIAPTNQLLTLKKRTSCNDKKKVPRFFMPISQNFKTTSRLWDLGKAKEIKIKLNRNEKDFNINLHSIMCKRAYGTNKVLD